MPSKSVLPQGIGKGKTAAIVAAVAIAAGGIYLYRQQQQKKQQPWTERVEQDRAAIARTGRF